ncbi:hypothetical protein [Actinomadura nitritigenes]|uniref:Peptidase M41 domain-containing protein n=1 Tax=Actinomadura nitritigenes TaxID=134602 RepID=A0ABS3R0N5_9ACTN|nr:hypothetical protein [Actinomadura nitritigenes]MBO2439803.1 hypothetical protein [Actinomadura nitritigenes]
MGSRETALQIYGGLSEADKRVVDAWRELGNDLVTSLLNSRVLTSGPRVRAVDDLAGWSERLYGSAPGLLRRESAEHEAAHAITARALGVRLVSVWITSDGSGLTTFEATDRERAAAIYAASDVWVNTLRHRMFPAGGEAGCRSDRRQLIRATGGDDFAMRAAYRRAREVLDGYRDEVLALAEVLEQHGRIEF